MVVHLGGGARQGASQAFRILRKVWIVHSNNDGKFEARSRGRLECRGGSAFGRHGQWMGRKRDDVTLLFAANTILRTLRLLWVHMFRNNKDV